VVHLKLGGTICVPWKMIKICLHLLSICMGALGLRNWKKCSKFPSGSKCQF